MRAAAAGAGQQSTSASTATRVISARDRRTLWHRRAAQNAQARPGLRAIGVRGASHGPRARHPRGRIGVDVHVDQSGDGATGVEAIAVEAQVAAAEPEPPARRYELHVRGQRLADACPLRVLPGGVPRDEQVAHVVAAVRPARGAP